MLTAKKSSKMTAMTASSTEEDCSLNLSASRIPIMSVTNLFQAKTNLKKVFYL